MGALMVSTTGTRPNFYEILGLSPSASADEVDRAYGHEILKPRPFGGLAEVGIAYATLKDPAKRRAYDQAIGVAAKPEPKPLHASWSWSVHVPAPTSRSPEAAPELRQDRAAEASPAQQREPNPEPPESSIAASLRQLADPAPVPQAQAPRAAPHSPPPPPHGPLVAPLAELPAGEAGEVEWRRPAMVGGGLLLGAVLFGAWAGTAVRDPGEPVEAQSGVTVPVPTAKRSAAAAPAPRDAADSEAALAQSAPVRAALTPVAVPAAKAARADSISPPRPVPLTPDEERQLAGGAFVESAASQAPQAADAMSEAPAATPASAARLPLPERTVARTIGRIGYACGSVASITPVDGASGVFKVACSSGDSYQARPVRGRYHFRRWGRS